MNHFFCLSLLLTLFFFNSCSSRNLTQNYFTTPHPHPTPSSLESSERLIAIATLNDLNGQIDGVNSHGMRIGGLELIKNYLTILKKNYPQNLLSLSTGHLIPHDTSQDLTESLLSQISDLPIDFFGISYREIGDISSLSMPEKKLMKSSFINSNIFKIKNSQLIEDPPVAAYAIQEINDVKFGIISVAPAHENKVITGTYFQDPIPAILKTRNILLKNNVDVIVLLSHFPTQCETKTPEKNKKAHLLCEENQGLSLLIKRLPPKSIDIILTTGERFTYGIHPSGIYVLNTPGNGLYLGHLQLVFDLETKSINHEKTSVFVPTLLCENFYQLTQDCYLGDNKKRFQALQDSKFEKIQATFFGETINSTDK